jgi:hypothetical protein
VQRLDKVFGFRSIGQRLAGLLRALCSGAGLAVGGVGHGRETDCSIGLLRGSR